MPRIETFDAGNLALHPSETGVEAQAGAARRIGVFYNQQAGAAEMLARETERLGSETQQLGRETEQLGTEKGTAMRQAGQAIGSGIAAAGDAAVNYLDHQQISHGSAAYATLFQNATQQWNATLANADPNDPHVAQRFMENLEGDLQNFKNNGFYTEKAQQWAENHVEALRQHFAEKSIEGMSTLAGEAVRTNSAQSLNALSATVHSDPTSIDMALASWKSSLEGTISTSPNLGGNAGAVRLEMAQKGAESIVKSAAIGYIEKNASMPPWISDPKYSPYVNGAELKTFESAAKAQAKSNELVAKQTQETNKRLADIKAHTDANKAFTDNVSIGPDGKPVVNPNLFKDALAVAKNNPGAPTAGTMARTLFDWGEHQQSLKTPVVTDTATASALDARMFASENPTSTMELLRAEADHKMSRADAEVRMKIVSQRDKMPTDPQFKLAMDGAKQLIEGRTAGEKDMQAGKYPAFMQEFLNTYQQQKAAGTLPPNALNLRDPKSLISQTMEAYKSPLASAIGGNGGVAPAPAAPASNVPAPATAPKYSPGDVVNTSEGPRRFKGGNYRDKANWEPVS